MKLVATDQENDFQSEIKQQFAKFSRSHPRNRSRRYPQYLKDLACEALSRGVSPKELRQLTGLSAENLKRWSKPVITPSSRRLEVIGSPQATNRVTRAVVRLSSGVTIELTDITSLNGQLLEALASLGGENAPSS